MLGLPLVGRRSSAHRPEPQGPASESNCPPCTHRILHLHVAHGGVGCRLGPVRQLLVAACFGIQQVRQRAQLEMVSVCKAEKHTTDKKDHNVASNFLSEVREANKNITTAHIVKSGIVES